MTNKTKNPANWQRCRICGCSEFSACSYIGNFGRQSCYWIKPNLCSHPRCVQKAALAALAEGTCVVGVIGGALAAVSLWPADFALAGLAAILMCFWAWWWSGLREVRLRGRADATAGLGAWRDWAFWLSIVASLSLCAAGIYIANKRLPPERQQSLLAMPRAGGAR